MFTTNQPLLRRRRGGDSVFLGFYLKKKKKKIQKRKNKNKNWNLDYYFVFKGSGVTTQFLLVTDLPTGLGEGLGEGFG